MIDPAADLFSDESSQESVPMSHNKEEEDDPVKSILSKIDNIDDDSNFASVDLDSFSTMTLLTISIFSFGCNILCFLEYHSSKI